MSSYVVLCIWRIVSSVRVGCSGYWAIIRPSIFLLLFLVTVPSERELDRAYGDCSNDSFLSPFSLPRDHQGQGRGSWRAVIRITKLESQHNDQDTYCLLSITRLNTRNIKILFSALTTKNKNWLEKLLGVLVRSIHSFRWALTHA